MKRCAVLDCNRSFHARGYCHKHYRRFLRHGDPLGGVERGTYLRGATLEERFWLRVDRRETDECWPWLGDCSLLYGRIWNGDRTPSGVPVKVFAHRLSYELAFGPIPEGMQVLHQCDNPPCCNPAHLFLGTQSANMRDCVAKGRHASHPRLNAAQVALIRERSGEPKRKLAREFGVGLTTVKDVLSGRTW